MRRLANKLSVILWVALSLLFSSARAETIANWTFDSLVLGAGNTNSPPNGLLNNVYCDGGNEEASGSHATAGTVYSTPVGNGSAKSINANNWSVGDYYQFTVSTVGFEDINLSYDQASSGTGPASFQLSYAVNGTDFKPFSSMYTVSGSSWTSGSSSGASTVQFDLSAITALNNSPSVYFHIVDVSTLNINGGQVTTAGTDRVDNFIVTGTLVPEPTIIVLGMVGGLACLIAARRKH
jgi:hypothetical protein